MSEDKTQRESPEIIDDLSVEELKSHDLVRGGGVDPQPFRPTRPGDGRVGVGPTPFRPVSPIGR
jgi:hypothetical protein